MVLLCYWTSAQNAGAQFVDIPDLELERAIRMELGKPTGDLTVSDLESLKSLDAGVWARGCFMPPIRSLVGLEKAINLEQLYLAGTDCTGTLHSVELMDYSPIAGLGQLSTLDLSQNNLRIIELPAGFTNLVELRLFDNWFLGSVALEGGFDNLATLDLRGNQLTNLTLPDGLTHLATLNLAGNRMTDPSFLERLPGLIRLDLNGNQLTNLHLPGGLPRLSELHLRNNRLTNVVIPRGLNDLRVLRLGGNQLSTLELPGDLTNLTGLYVDNNRLTDLTLPNELDRLTTLHLQNNQLSSLTLPIELDHLYELYLQTNQITHLILPGRLTNLSTLNISANRLASLILPGELGNLISLDLSDNQLTGLTLPDGLTHLNSLYLDNNRLWSLTLPDDVFGLRSLNLGFNQLTHLTVPVGLTNLAALDLSDNQLTALYLPQGLTHLNSLSLDNNQLTHLTLSCDLYGLSTLSVQNNRLESLILPEGLSSLATIDVTSNPIIQISMPYDYPVYRLNLSGFDKNLMTVHAGFLRLEDGWLFWDQGVLQYSDGVNGPWWDLPAASPLNLATINGAGFFRAIIRVEIPGIHRVPGRVEAENFLPGGGLFEDNCAGAIGYCDSDAGNLTGAYRPWEDVDIMTHGNGYRVAWNAEGEWRAYRIDVARSGTYMLSAEVTSGTGSTKALGVEIDGERVATREFNEAHGWNVGFEIQIPGISLEAGEHVLRMIIDKSGFDLDYIDFILEQ